MSRLYYVGVDGSTPIQVEANLKEEAVETVVQDANERGHDITKMDCSVLGVDNE